MKFADDQLAFDYKYAEILAKKNVGGNKVSVVVWCGDMSNL